MFRRLFKKTESTYKISIPKLSVELDAPSDVTILEHALMKGVAFPHSCRVGTCGTCKARLVSGKVYELTDKASTLTADELRSLLKLEPNYREVLVLRFYEELSLEEIASLTRAPLSTVKSRLYRGLAALKPEVEQLRTSHRLAEAGQ